MTTLDRLGDVAINAANHTQRHNHVITAWYNAISAVATTSTLQGDKGSGPHHSAKRQAARQRYAPYNATYIPDTINHRPPKTILVHRKP